MVHEDELMLTVQLLAVLDLATLAAGRKYEGTVLSESLGGKYG